MVDWDEWREESELPVRYDDTVIEIISPNQKRPTELYQICL